jgi:hypothetical protein
LSILKEVTKFIEIIPSRLFPLPIKAPLNSFG